MGRLHVGKDGTYRLERDHARQRHRLARFRRRSIVVSTAVRMIDASIALFARFGGNDQLGDLLSMLAQDSVWLVTADGDEIEHLRR